MLFCMTTESLPYTSRSVTVLLTHQSLCVTLSGVLTSILDPYAKSSTVSTLTLPCWKEQMVKRMFDWLRVNCINRHGVSAMIPSHWGKHLINQTCWLIDPNPNPARNDLRFRRMFWCKDTRACTLARTPSRSLVLVTIWAIRPVSLEIMGRMSGMKCATLQNDGKHEGRKMMKEMWHDKGATTKEVNGVWRDRKIWPVCSQVNPKMCEQSSRNHQQITSP